MSDGGLGPGRDKRAGLDSDEAVVGKGGAGEVGAIVLEEEETRSGSDAEEREDSDEEDEEGLEEDEDNPVEEEGLGKGRKTR